MLCNKSLRGVGTNLTNISHVKMLTFWLVLNYVFIYFRFTGIRISERHW